MAGAKDVQVRRPGFAIGFLSLLVIGQADFHIPSILKADVATTTTCAVCGTMTPSATVTLGPITVSAESLRGRAKAVAGVAPADGPGPNFQQAKGPRLKSSNPTSNVAAAPADGAIFAATTPAPPGALAFLHPAGKKMNIPMIAGVATGGAVVAAGVVAAAVEGVKWHKEQVAKKAAEAKAAPTNLIPPAIKARQGPAAAPAATAAPAPVQPLASTFLKKPVMKGDTVIEVADVVGFAVGDTIKIGEEFNAVKGFASITLDHPMNHNIEPGSVVQVIHEPANAARVQPTTTLDVGALNNVLSANPAVDGPPVALPKMITGNHTTPAPAEIVKGVKDTSMMTAFYCVLAGILGCCVFWSLIAGVCLMISSKKKRGSEKGYSRFEAALLRSSDEDEDEAEDEEEEDEEELESEATVRSEEEEE